MRSIDSYHRILIIKPGAMGDLLHLTPVLRGLKEQFPEAKVTVLVGSTASRELFRYNPNVDGTIVYDRWNEHRTLRGLWTLRQLLKQGRYDLVINFQRSNLKTWLLASAAFPCRLLIYHKTRNRVIHAVEDHFKTVAPLRIPHDGPELEFYIGARDMTWARSFLDDHGALGHTIVALNLGASNRIKCWSPRQFAGVADRLADDGIRVLLIGGEMERDLADELQALLRRPCLDLVGALSIGQLGAILASCHLLVSGDTGPLHLATAVKTPVVALFGAIDPERTGPVGDGHRVLRHTEVACVPCNDRKCRNAVYLECMEKITVDEVYLAVMERIGKSDESC